MAALNLCTVFFLLFLTSLQIPSLFSQNITCNSKDLEALNGFMNLIESGLERWNLSANCCSWDGVICNSSSILGLQDDNSYRVAALELGTRRISGELSDKLGVLDQLRTLNLSHNFLRGSIPLSVFHLPNLEVMDLSSNHLSGNLPSSSYSLPRIQHLDVSENSLAGSVSSGFCNGTSSDSIRILNFSENFFSGVLPFGFGNCTSLQQLYVTSNSIHGNLPDDLFRLRQLTHLDVEDNKFSGHLDNGVGNLSNLVKLDVSLNMFSGEIPNVFSSFWNLQRFMAHSNRFTGSIPSSLSNSRSIIYLNLRNNSLQGKIEVNCEAMTQLASLDLGSNRFNGSIPDNLPSCHQLKSINLARNNFDGGIPESFKDFDSLSYLSLSNSSISNISEALRILQHCENLTTLVLTRNFREEELPSDPSLLFEKLKVLVIANCQLSGSIPAWLEGSKRLQLLDLSLNRMTGRIPVWFGNYQSLFYLDLSGNSLIGEMPKSLTGLQSFITENDSLLEPSPDFPLFQKRNTTRTGLQYNRVWSIPPTLSLSHNFLNGSIWPEFGNLKRLHFLDLKFNNLSGSIPSSLSGMTMLESLDLSNNNLTGIIPPSLVNLSFLSKFSVANNQLYGKIPTGGQFSTFQDSSFEGNKGLCGDHASVCKVDVEVPEAIPKKARRNRGTIIGMAIGIGFATIFLLSILLIIILRMQSRRGVDPVADEIDMNGKESEQQWSKSVILFQNKDYNNEVSVDDLLKSTNNFDESNIIGCGGFGLVYRATLPDGKKVAIKRLTGDCGQMEREFQAEVESLSRAQHPNLVLLRGYCTYRTDRLLIYSYMENNSLDYWLHEKSDGATSLDWITRLRIAKGAARGLAYLHLSCVPRIVHRDIKSSNILLNEEFEAHLADFGLARLILPNRTHVTTDVVGTLGYIPPEYGQATIATYKGDIYSFGVVLLELLTGKRPMDMCKPRECRDLISWVFQMKRDKKATEVFDPFISDKQHDNEMLRVLEIACLCLGESPKSRPSTQNLVAWLDEIGSCR